MDWTAIFTNLGVSGVLAWYLYYNTTCTLPAMLQAFRDELEHERAQRDAMAERFVTAITHLEERNCPFGKHAPQATRGE